MLLRIHNGKTNRIEHGGFLVDPRGRVVSESADGSLHGCKLQVGRFLDRKEVYVGDAVIINLEENNLTMKDMNETLKGLGVVKIPDNYDTVVVEITQGQYTEYCNVLFELKGETIKQPFVDAGGSKYFVVMMQEFNFISRLAHNLLFVVGYNCTSPEWKAKEYFY